MFEFKFKANFDKIPSIQRAWRAFMKGDPASEITRGVHKALQIYSEYLFERFNRGGDGDWAPLAESTIKQKGHSEILIDTYTLRNSLLRMQPIIGHNQIGVRIPSLRHPKSKLSTNELAQVHQFGLGRKLPARPIMVNPNSSIQLRMAKEIQKGCVLFGKKHSDG